MPSQVSTPTNPASLTKSPQDSLAFVESSRRRRRRADKAEFDSATQQQQQQSVDVFFGPEHDWTSGKATTNSRELNHNGKQYRVEAPDKLVLVATATTTTRRSEQLDSDDTDEGRGQSEATTLRADSYKCLAINIVGQQASEPLEAQHNCEFPLSAVLSSWRAADPAQRWPLIWANQSKPTN